jgi:type IV pilus assembly protein PilY1
MTRCGHSLRAMKFKGRSMMTQVTKNKPSRWRRALRHCLIAAAGLSAGWSLAQTISDVPLVVKNNVPPNFMFMLDNSGSMNNLVPGGSPYVDSNNYTPSWCTSASGRTLAAGSSVDVRIETSGTFANSPLFVVNGGNTRRAFGTDDSGYGRRCFDRTATYSARLLTNNTSNGARSPSGYFSARYTGNFLNWYFSGTNGGTNNWTDRKSLTAGSIKSRMEIARASATNVLNTQLTASTPAGVRVGLSRYNGDDGGRLGVDIADFTPAHRTTLTNAIAGLTPSGNTPLAETLADIGRYMATGYSGNVSAGSVTNVAINNFLMQKERQSCLSGANCATGTTDAVPATPATGTPTRPTQYWCQRNYAFLMTDGRPNADQAFSSNTYLRDYDGDCSGVNAASCSLGGGFDRKNAPRSYEAEGSDYLDDVAKALFDVDLRPNLVAPPGRTKKNNLRTYTIGFADQDALNDPLLQKTADQGGGKKINADSETQLTAAFRQVITDAFSNDAAAAAVAVANPQVAGGDGVGYASSYRAGEWYGDLVSYSVDTSTGLQTGGNLWQLRSTIDATPFASRKIVSFNGTAGLPFTAANFPALETSTGMVDFLRGDQSRETDLPPGFRNRTSALGDIINAEPVVVNYAGGVPIIFQGANDGMLHVVDGRTASAVATRGQELWAYVPRLLHGSLTELATQGYSHKYFVDATPAAAEVTGVGSVSRLLVGGLGKGGRGFYALDISSYQAATATDAASKVLWEFGQGRANMGYSFGKPLIVRTAAGWRVLVTSGYDNGTATGGDGHGYVWVLNPADGSVLATIDTGVGTAGNPSGLAHLSSMANTAADALVRYVYSGDLLGNVWRFDLNNNSATKIAEARDTTGAAQSISSPPEVGPVSGSSDKVYVYVGTGRYFSEQDVPGGAGATAGATQQQSLYGYIDDTAQASPTLPNTRGTNGASCPTGGGNGALVCQSLTYVPASNTYNASTHAVDTTSKRGWYLDWPVDTQLSFGRVIGKPTLTRRGTLALTVNIPKEERCLPGGNSWFFALYAPTGGAVPSTSTGDTYYDGAGSFLRSALASRVVVITTADGTRGLTRQSDVSTQSTRIKERPPCDPTTGTCECVPTPPALTCDPSGGGVPTWRRIYWRTVN